MACANILVAGETEARDAVLRRIQQISSADYEEFSDTDRRRHLGQLLRAVGLWAEQARPSTERHSRETHFLEFARDVWAATRDSCSRDVVLHAICDNARSQYDRVSEADKRTAIGRVLRATAVAAESVI